VDHGSGMNYPTTTASGTWTTRSGISSYGWDSRQPIDPCSRCTNVPPPLPGSQYTTHIYEQGYGANDRISVSGHMSDHRGNSYNSNNQVGSGYGSDNRGGGYGSGTRGGGYGSDNRDGGYGYDNRGSSYGIENRPNDYGINNRRHNSYLMNSRPNEYSSNGHVGNGYISGNNYDRNKHVTNNHVIGYGGFNANGQMGNSDYRGNGYDNLSPEWERRHNNNKKGSEIGTGGGYYQGVQSYPISNVLDGQGAQMQGIHHNKPSNDRWNIKGAYPVKIESGYWQSQPPKDIGWDEDSKKVGVIAGWIGGPKKYNSGKPSHPYASTQQPTDKDDDYFNKGTTTGFDNADRKKPYTGWGGSGSYEVVKINNGYKYIDRNGNGDYSAAYGNNYGYGGQNYNYNKPSHDYGTIPLNSVDQGRPHGHIGQSVYDKPLGNAYNKPTTVHGDYDKPSSAHDYHHGSRPNIGWGTSRPVGFEVTASRPPAWGSQRPGYPVIASRPTQHWGENSLFSEQQSAGVVSVGHHRPDSYDHSRPSGYSGSGDGGGRPDYGSGGKPFVGSMHHGSQMVSDYGSQTTDFDKFSGYNSNDDNTGSGGRPHHTNNRPSYDSDNRPFANGNEVYGSSQQQTSSGYGKGYASNWDYHSNYMR